MTHDTGTSKTKPPQKDASATFAVGEIISSSITQSVIEVWSKSVKLEEKPHFGSFLKIDSAESKICVIAVVYNVITGPTDNVHKPYALGMTREELRVAQPHIFSLLKTELHAVTVGYMKGGTVYQHLPPSPPDVHDFVYPLMKEDLNSLTEECDFLRLLTTVSSVPSDELIAAAIREAYEAKGRKESFLVSAGQALSQLLRQDYDRLISILKKIRPA